MRNSEGLGTGLSEPTVGAIVSCFSLIRERRFAISRVVHRRYLAGL